MKNLEIHTTRNSKVEVEVCFSKSFAGHGHYKILCEADFKGNKKTFSQTTNDMPWIDSLSEFKEENNPSWEEETDFYLDKFQWDFEERINDWVDELLESNN